MSLDNPKAIVPVGDPSLPGGWKRGPLRDHMAAKPKNGYSAREVDHHTGTSVLGLGCLTAGGFKPIALKQVHPSPRTSAALLYDGDLLISRSNTRELVGLAGVFKDTGSPTTYPDLMMRLTPAGTTSARFLEALLRSPDLRRQIQALATGTSGSMVKISSSIVQKLEILIPPKPEQARITEVLDTLDEAIRGTENVVAKLGSMGPGMLQELVFPWLNHNQNGKASLKAASESMLGGNCPLPTGWTWARLEDLAEVERGKFTYRPRNEPKLFGGNYPFIQTGDVVRALGKEIRTASQWLNEAGMRFSREFPAGTIAVTIAANIADTAILGIPMCFPDSVVGVVVRKPHCNRFVELCIRVAKHGLEARAPQSAQKNINLQDLRPLWIPTPPSEEQERIAAAYEAHESRISEEVARLEKLRAIKSGLSSDLLTGRVRVLEGASTC